MADINDLFDEKKDERRICERCDRQMTFYSDEAREHDLHLCWGCGKFNGSTHVDDDFNELIIVNPSLILELIEDKSLIKVG